MNIAEVQLSYKSKVKASDRPVIYSSEDAVKLLIERVYDPEMIEYKEFTNILLLNRGNKVLGFYPLATGGTSQCVVDVKIVLQAALLTNSAAVILSHNHPSGNPNPSTDDHLVTARLQKACEAVGITLFDHIIVTPEGKHYSFADEGKL